ncbi:hypothetical protein J6590_051568 [Homalodisca vitripennis]|nr:hypothetical protein J6590_051568 [Homalodisca vitripennis]
MFGVNRMGSEREQQFCLRWHNYQNCLLATLPQLLDGDDLTDVTLCAGGRNIKAHKVVLSACNSNRTKIAAAERESCQSFTP